MDTIRLRQDVGLVFIVTEELKNRLLDEYNAAAEEITRQMDQFDFRARHALAELQRTDLNRAMQARQQIEAEKQRLTAIKHELGDRRREVEVLEIGTEYPRGTIEGYVDIAIGDNLFAKLAGYQVVVKDGTVIDIREQKLAPEDVILPQQQPSSILLPGQQ
jgi:hypothetical protein